MARSTIIENIYTTYASFYLLHSFQSTMYYFNFFNKEQIKISTQIFKVSFLTFKTKFEEDKNTFSSM